MKTDVFEKFEKKLGFAFNDKRLLRQAFTHRSYINENRGLDIGHNERLEFLGDAVLELITTDFLYEKYPEGTEGDLTSYRAAMVNAITLSGVAAGLGMNDLLLLSKGESKDNGRARQYILANTYEALVGALYLDQGYGAAKKFISENLFALIHEIVAKKLWLDSKSFFQELAQEKVGITPSYTSLRESGPDHDKQFTVGVYLGKELVAEGTGKSKQEAEQEAANAGLVAKGWR
jgi:ribonuclease-3